MKSIKILKVKMSISGVFFLCSYCMYSFVKLIYTSMVYLLVDPNLMMTFRWCSIAAAILSIITNKKWTTRALCASGILFAVSLLVYRNVNTVDFLCVIMILIASYRNDLKKLFTCTLALNVLFISIVPILCAKGVIPNNEYRHFSTITQTFSNAFSFGFLHYSNIAFIALYISIVILYMTNFNLKAIVCTLIFNIFIFAASTAKLSLGIYIFILLIYMILKKMRLLEKWTRPLLQLSSVLPIVLFLVSIISVYLYSSGSKLFHIINTLTQNRLSLAKHGIDTYGFNLFGHPIEMHGTFFFLNNKNSNLQYFFIDNDYVYIGLEYGLIILCVVLISFTLMMRVFIRENNVELFCLSITPLFFGLINSSFLVIEFNPIIMIGFNMLLGVGLPIEEKKDDLERRKKRLLFRKIAK